MKFHEDIMNELALLENSEQNQKRNIQKEKLICLSKQIRDAENKRDCFIDADDYDNAVEMEKLISGYKSEYAALSKIVDSFSSLNVYPEYDVNQIYNKIQSHYDEKDKAYWNELVQCLKKTCELMGKGQYLKQDEDSILNSVGLKTGTDIPYTNREYYHTHHYHSVKQDIDRIQARLLEINRAV